jgi:hypothetical protein
MKQGRNGHGDASILGKTRGKHIMSVNVRVNVSAISSSIISSHESPLSAVPVSSLGAVPFVHALRAESHGGGRQRCRGRSAYSQCKEA